MKLRYRVVDVFTQQALEGNALAVFTDGSGLDGQLMQRIAKELNLSETVFVLPSAREDCAARLRIFTPTRELKFAGHPTVGAAWVLLDEGMVRPGTERFVLEEEVGPVPIRVEAGESPLIWLRTPSIRFGRTFERNACAKALGLEGADLSEIQPQLVTAGNSMIFVAVKDKNAVDRASLDMQGLRSIKASGEESACVFVFTPTPEGAYSRMFAPEMGIVEDPATGSATGPLAAYMMQHELVARELGNRFVSEQGTKMGRRSFLHIHAPTGQEGIEVGGYVTPVADAAMHLR